ncbi:zeta toxin family protein [Nocardia sp. NPDC003693]
MALEFPSWLEWLEWVVGSDWPHGNEDLMWQMGRDLQAVADEADFLLGDIDKLLGDVRKAYPEGTGGEQILTWLQPLRDGTGPEKNGSVQELAEHFQSLATSADTMGDQLQAAKLNFYIAGGWLVAELAWAAFGGPFAPALHAAALASGRVIFRALGGAFLKRIFGNIVRRITAPLLRKISPKLIYEIVQESIEETLQGTSQEMLVQYIQKKTGHIDEYNWDAVKDNAMISAIAGAAGGAAGFGGAKLFPTNMGGARGAFNGALTGAGAGAVGAGAAWLGGGLVTGELGEFDPRSLTGGALSGAGPSAIHGARGLSPDAGPVRAPSTDPTTTPSTNTPGTTPGTNPSSNSPAGTNGANSPGSGQNGANQNGANSNGANQNGATNGENGGSNQPANSGDTNGKGSDTSTANQQGGESPSNNGESAPSNGKESGDTHGRGNGPEADGKPDATTATDGKTDADTRSDAKAETRSEADTKADQTGRALNDSSSQPNTTTSPDTATTTNQHATTATNTTSTVSASTTAPNTTAPTTSTPNTTTSTTTSTTSTTSTTTTTSTANTSTTAPNTADTRAGSPADPARSAPGPRADVAGPRTVDAPAMTTRASIGDATFAHPGASIPIQAAQTGVEAAAKTDQTPEQQGQQSNPDVEQAVPVPVPVPVLPIGVDPPAPTPPADTTARPEGERQMAKNFKPNSTMPGGQITFGELSPKAKQLVNALAENPHIPIRAGEVSISHLAELQQFAGAEHAIVQNRNGDLRLFRGEATRTRIPPDLAGDYVFTVHTHPEDRMPGPPSEHELRLGTHTTNSMHFDLRSKDSPHTEAVVSRDGQVRFFNNEGVFDLPAGVHPKNGPINDRGYVVPVPNLDTDFASQRQMTQEGDPDALPENQRNITQDSDQPDQGPDESPPRQEPEQSPPESAQPVPDTKPSTPDADQETAQPKPEQTQPEQDSEQAREPEADQPQPDDSATPDPATELDPPASDLERGIEAEHGIPVENQRKIQKYANENDLQMFVRPTNPDSVPHLKEGAMPKPMSVKDKTINDLDIALGAPADAKGLVGRFAPGMLEMPDTTDMTPQEIQALEKRLSDREKDFDAYREYMQKLIDLGDFQVRADGVLEALVDGEPVAITGDHDLFDIRHADGTRLTPAELAHHEDQLKDISADIMHGPHVYWNPDTEFQRQRNFEPIIENHQQNPANPKAEPLVRFEPNQEPAVVWADKDLAAIDREMTPWHLETDLQKLGRDTLAGLEQPSPDTVDPQPSRQQPTETDPRRQVEQDIDRLRDLARDLANDPDFDHADYRAWLNDELTTPTEVGTPAHKIATIKLEALAGTNPADIVRTVEALGRDVPAPPADPTPEAVPSNDQDPNDPIQSGGSTRPRDVLDPVIQGAWADAAYDAFRASPSDVDDMHRNLSDVERLDGTTGFTRQEIEQVKRHLFEQEHQLSVFDDDGNVVGYETRRFDSDPDIAEAWMRLSRGEPLPADIRLLEHELAEADFLRRNPDATYREAHAYANSQSDWESDIPNRTGENYERWAAKDGGVHRVPEVDPNTDNPDVPVREQPGESRPPSGDPDGRHGRQTGGRLEQPTGDQGRGTHSGPVESGRDLAGRGRDSSLEPGRREEAANRPPTPPQDSTRPEASQQQTGHSPQQSTAAQQPNSQQGEPQTAPPSPQEQAILDAVERLTPAERDALQDYAGDAYNEINRHLRFGEPLDTVSPETIDLIRSGLDKLPDHVGPVKRSIMLSPEQMESFWNANRKGAVVEDPAFVSTSKTKFKWNPNVKLTILSATGKDISYLQPPAKRGEQEVLIPDGRQFRVLNRVMDENGVMHVTWAEIADTPRSPDQGDTNPVVAQMDQEADQPFPQHLLPNLDTPFSLDFGDPAPSGTTPAAPDTAARGDDPPRDTHAPTTKPEESPDSRERRSTVPDESGSQPADPDSTPSSENDRSPRPDDEWSRMEPRQIAEELENRWDVEAVGFDNPDLDPEAVREFARAVDTMLSRYPDVDLERVVIEPLGRNTYARATSYKNSDGTMSVDSLALNARYATDPELMARHAAEDEADGHLVPGSADRPVYSTLVHEFAHAIAFEGQERSAATAQEALEKYYEATRGGMDKAGFDAWLSQLSGYSFDDNGLLDGDEALAEAFTDVELNGEAASEPAKVLFWHLLDGARQDSPIPNLFDVLPDDIIARPSGVPSPDTGAPTPVAPVTFSHADGNHQRTRSEQGSPDPEQQPNTEQEPDATEPSQPETSQPESSESPQDGTPTAEPSPDLPENDRPDTLTDHLRSRFEQLRSIATDIILAEQDPALHGELPSLRDDYASLLDKLGMLDPATADTPWRLLDQHQSALAEYLSTNHTFLVPSVSDPVAVTDETTAPATTESALAPQDTTAPTQQPGHSPIPTPAPISAAEIEAVHGIPVENQRKIQEYADNNNLRFDVRPTNPDAVRHLQAGRMPKPMEIKDKTINDLDIALGAPAEHKGLVGRFAPGMLEMPDTTGMTDAEIAALEKRLADRTKDFASYQKKMAEYADKFEVREDGVVQAILPDQSRVPITGDHDMFDLRHADGTRLSPAELEHHENELSTIKAGIMHGPHVYWNPDADQRIRNFEPIVDNHQYDPANPSAEPLIRFQPNQDPQVTWAAMDLDAINRDMTPWHLETGLQKLFENTATRLEQAAPEQDTRARVESDIDQLRNIANELSRHPDFDHATYLSLLTGVPVTPETADSPAHKMATIALEARNGTDPADIVRMVRDAQVPVTTTAPSTETGSDTSTDPEKNDPDDDTPPAEPAPRNPDRGPSGPPKGPSEAAPTEPGPTRPEAADLTGQPAVDSTLDPTTPGPSETTPADSEPARHDHTTAPTTTDAKVVADLNEHPGGVEIDADGLLKTVDGRPIQEHVDTMARERAEAFRTAAAEFSQRPGEKPIKTQKRVLQAQQNGTYVSPKTHGQVTAVVQDLRTGIAYEGVNGTADNVIPENELHPTLRANIEAMEARAREQEQGGYEALDRNGNPERNPETFEGFPEGTRPHPHFDDPYGHAEVKAANEALWARERENDQRRADGRTDLLPTGPEALAEMYSQTYKPFATDGPEATPYCANCDQTMLQAHNFSGRYTGFPPSTENLTDAYEPAPNPEAEPASAPTDVDDSVPPSDPAGAGPIDTGDTDQPSRENAKPSENALPQQDTDDIPPMARGVDPVTPEQLERVFHEQIVPKLLSGATSVPDTETPEVVVVGGQMGAGKSTMIADVVATFADRGGVTQISGDDFFKFHPRYPELMATHDADAIRHLLADARPWFRMALEHVMANRQNVILELAMGDPVKEAGLIREFVDNGYTARAEVMAVSEPQSRLSTINRYLSERIDDGVHRYTPPWLHDASYTGSQQMVGELESDAPPVRLESLTVRSRTETLYQNTRDEDGNWTEPPRAAEVLSGERDRPWTPDEKQLYQEQLAQVRQRMAEMAAQRPAETETLETLGRDLRATEDNARPRFDTETPPVRLDEDTGRPPEPADTETATRQTQTAQAQQQVSTVAEQQHEFLRAAEQRDLDASDPVVHEQIRASYVRAHELVDLATASNKAALRILAVIDEWHPSKGGVIAVNKNLCEALAALGHEVFVRVGHELTGNEGADTVTLIAPRTSDPNTPLRDQLVSDMSDLPPGIDAVIGHTRFSGPAAREIRNTMYPEATLVHMVHMIADAYGRVQGKPEKGATNLRIEADLVSTSDVAVGVGPALSEEAARLAAMTETSPVLHQLNPGVEFFDQVRPPADRRTMRMLVFGRADDPVKGTMEAAKMVRALNARGIDVDLIVRGVPEAKVADHRRLLTRAAGREVDVRPYTLDRDEILADMRDANVVLMPSHIEAFGLVATETAGAGVPMVVPSASGAGRFFGDDTVFPSELTDGMLVEQGPEGPVSVEAWAAVLESQLSDQDGAWDRALQLQQILRDQQFTWESAATALIDATRAVPPADKPVAGIPGQNPDVETPPSARAGLPSAPSNLVANSELSPEDTVVRRESEPDSSASGRASVPDPSAPGRASVPDSSTPSEPTTPNMTPPADESTMTGPQPEQTPAGASFHPDPADPVAELARRVQPDPDRFTVDAHVDANGNFRVGDRTYTPEEFANLLRRTGWDGTTPIRLIGCDAATNGAATRLAQALGVDVLAPTKPAWTDARGNVFTSSTEIGPDGNRRPRIPPDGVWETHHADGSKTKATDDGYAPGVRAAGGPGIDADNAHERAADPALPDHDSSKDTDEVSPDSHDLADAETANTELLDETQQEADRCTNWSPSKLRPAVAEGLRLASGEMFTAPSLRGEPAVLHPDVQQILDAIPEAEQGNGHGSCGLPQCISKALFAGLDPTGAKAAAKIVRSNSEHAKHGYPVGPCRSCRPLEKHYSLDFITGDGK